jgi:hypothetical protein
MSAAPASFPNMVSATPTANITPLKKAPWMRVFYFRDWRHPARFCWVPGSESVGVAHCRPLDSRDDVARRRQAAM